jgi:hypothetical protein
MYEIIISSSGTKATFKIISKYIDAVFFDELFINEDIECWNDHK